jgi:hypothetical protein
MANSLATALAGTSYYSFTVQANAGYELDLISLIFDANKDPVTGPGANPPVTIDLRSDAGGDNFATSLGSFGPTGNSGNFAVDLTASLLAAAFQNVTSTIEFRLYMYDGSTSTSSTIGGHIDNVELNGDVFLTNPGGGGNGNGDPGVVPEPASIVVWSLLAAIGGVVAWRKRKATATR